MPDWSLDWVRQRLADHAPTRIDPAAAPRRAAVAIVMRELEAPDCCEMLFIHRSENRDDPWSGHMAFPGGRIEPEDLSPLHAAKRETLEEIGVDLESAELLGELDEVRASAGGTVIPLAISPFVFRLTGPVAIRCNPDEVDAVLWVPLRKLLDPASAGAVSYELAGQRFALPCFRIAERVIWGLTYQMVRRLFHVLEWRPLAA